MNKKEIIIIISGFLLLLFGVGFFFFLYEAKSTVLNTVATGLLPKLEPIDMTIAPVSRQVATPEPKPVEQVNLLFTGDIMLDRSVLLKTQASGDYSYPFKNLDYFNNYDFKIGNLEGPITDFKSVANGTGGNRLTFTFSPQFLEPLKNYFDVVSLANNHTNNFGKKGLTQTYANLEKVGIKYFGDPDNKNNLSVVIEKNNIKIGLVGFHELIGYGFNNVIAEIKKLRPEVNYIIVMPHWGTEYITDKPNRVQVSEAHKIIDAGADLIIGTHPHVIQPIEKYNSKIIFYSLGNFIFDQYFSPETQQGLNIGVNLKREYNNINSELTILPITVSSESQPSLAEGEVKQQILDALFKVSNVSSTVFGL
ncbi:MAG: CapA family protein [Candidatus Magasanikiibacteriota bacterium]